MIAIDSDTSQTEQRQTRFNRTIIYLIVLDRGSGQIIQPYPCLVSIYVITSDAVTDSHVDCSGIAGVTTQSYAGFGIVIYGISLNGGNGQSSARCRQSIAGFSIVTTYPGPFIPKNNVVLNSGAGISPQTDTWTLISFAVPDFIVSNGCIAVRAVSYARTMDIMDKIMLNNGADFRPEALEAYSPGVAGAYIIADNIIFNSW